MSPIKKGFVKRCAEYGMDKAAAKELFNKVAGGPDEYLDKVKKQRGVAKSLGPSNILGAAVKPPKLGKTPVTNPSWLKGRTASTLKEPQMMPKH